jgi:hypothetical protein
VLLGSGERFSVQLTNSARSPVKSYVVSVMEPLSRPAPDEAIGQG